MHSAIRRRQAFEIWLRTGRWPSAGFPEIEVKFNPWHDPENGRFTFPGAGRYFGSGSASAAGGVGQAAGRRQDVPSVVYGDDDRLPPISSMKEADAWRAKELSEHGDERGYREAIETRYQFYKNGFAPRSDSPFTEMIGGRTDSTKGKFDKSNANSRGGDSSAARKSPLASRGRSPRTGSSAEGGFNGGVGSFGGGGATGSWDDAPVPRLRQEVEGGPSHGSELDSRLLHSQSDQIPTQRRSQSDEDHWQHVSRNGYLYEIDDQNRTRRISGELTLNPDQQRSLETQRAAGGSDRRPSDHGGHYIARRFDGPTEAFNHFAQDANFNRSAYRSLEEEWARAKRAGKNVRVKIVPVYEGDSQRPSTLNVWFWIDGQRESLKFPNEPKGAKNAE